MPPLFKGVDFAVERGGLLRWIPRPFLRSPLAIGATLVVIAWVALAIAAPLISQIALSPLERLRHRMSDFPAATFSFSLSTRMASARNLSRRWTTVTCFAMLDR